MSVIGSVAEAFVAYRKVREAESSVRRSVMRAGRPSRRSEYVGPTPETLAKLQSDPLLAILRQYANDDVALERAADEIRAVYLAVCAKLMGGMNGGHGKPMSDFIAWVHAQTYLPWAQGLHRITMEAVIDVVVDRRHIHPTHWPSVASGLESYARRMKTRGSFEDFLDATQQGG